MNLDLLKRDLIRDEGSKRYPYYDSGGVMTIGVGHNLQDGISQAAENFILNEDIQKHCQDLDNHLLWWRNLDEVRQRVLANMCFNLGILTLLQFKAMLAALQAGDYSKTADEMGKSLWAQQVGPRAARLQFMILNGRDL